MCKNTVNEDIKNGVGLKPLSSSQNTSKPAGVTTEQRDQTPYSGIRRDIFTLQTESDKEGDK